MDLTYPPAQPPDVVGVPRKRISLHDVFLVYRQQFRRWFLITAPTSLIAAAVLFQADQLLRTIYRTTPRGGGLGVAEALGMRFGSFFVAWFLGCFALAAIASALKKSDDRDDSEVWKSDSHQRAREHFGGILFVALFSYIVFLTGAAADMLVTAAIVRVIGWARYSRLNQVASVVAYLIIASIVSWFGMAIPLIVCRGIRAWPALKKSVKVSNGYEIFLFLLVVESFIGSYVAWYATHYGLSLIFPASTRFTVWYAWFVYIVFILASAAVQPPMFIGFALLADGESSAELFPSPQQSP